MATVIDQLVVTLNLDTSGFSQAQRQALNGLNNLKVNAGNNAAAIGQSTQNALSGHLNVVQRQLSGVNNSLTQMGTTSRRTGQAVAAGAQSGAIGLKNLAEAAAATVAAITAVHETINGLTSASGRAAQTTRAAWAANLDPRALSAIQQYAFQTGNVDYGTTQSTLIGFEQKRQAYKAQGEYPEEFTKFAFWLGMSPAEAATLPIPELLRRVSTKLQADTQAGNGAQAQLIASQVGLGSLGFVLAQGPQALDRGIKRNLDLGLDEEQINRLTTLNKAINDFEVSWQNAGSAIIASHPEWTKAIDNLGHFLDWVTKDKDAAAAFGTALEVLAATSIVTAVAALGKLIVSLNAVWATPLLRFIVANPWIAGLIVGLWPTPAGEPGKPAMTHEQGAGVDVNKFTPQQAQQLLDTGSELSPDLRERLQKRARGETLPPPQASPTRQVPGSAYKAPDKLEGETEEQMLRNSAARYNVNPDDLVRLGQAEGGVDKLGQPYGEMDNGAMSYGPLQMHVGGLADEYRKATGLDPADPKNKASLIDFGTWWGSTHGWNAWSATKRTDGNGAPAPRMTGPAPSANYAGSAQIAGGQGAGSGQPGTYSPAPEWQGNTASAAPTAFRPGSWATQYGMSTSNDYARGGHGDPGGDIDPATGKHIDKPLTEQERKNDAESYKYIAANKTSWIDKAELDRVRQMSAGGGGGASTTNNSTSTGPITVNVPTGNPLQVGNAVQQAVRDSLVTHANTGQF